MACFYSHTEYTGRLQFRLTLFFSFSFFLHIKGGKKLHFCDSKLRDQQCSKGITEVPARASCEAWLLLRSPLCSRVAQSQECHIHKLVKRSTLIFSRIPTSLYVDALEADDAAVLSGTDESSKTEVCLKCTRQRHLNDPAGTEPSTNVSSRFSYGQFNKKKTFCQR